VSCLISEQPPLACRRWRPTRAISNTIEYIQVLFMSSRPGFVQVVSVIIVYRSAKCLPADGPVLLLPACLLMACSVQHY
jgi:hypothetical protein